MTVFLAWLSDLGVRLDDHEPDARQLAHIAAVRDARRQADRGSSRIIRTIQPPRRPYHTAPRPSRPPAPARPPDRNEDPDAHDRQQPSPPPIRSRRGGSPSLTPAPPGAVPRATPPEADTGRGRLLWPVGPETTSIGSAIASSTGPACPTPPRWPAPRLWQSPPPSPTCSEGETVLDLGSGGGIDVLLPRAGSARPGSPTGVDMTDEMLALRARERGGSRRDQRRVPARAGWRRIPLEAATFRRRRHQALRDQSLDRQGRRVRRDRPRPATRAAGWASAISSPTTELKRDRTCRARQLRRVHRRRPVVLRVRARDLDAPPASIDVLRHVRPTRSLRRMPRRGASERRRTCRSRPEITGESRARPRSRRPEGRRRRSTGLARSPLTSAGPIERAGFIERAADRTADQRAQRDRAADRDRRGLPDGPRYRSRPRR